MAKLTVSLKKKSKQTLADVSLESFAHGSPSPTKENRVIYEVQLLTPTKIQEPFEAWLRQHLEDMLQSPGFLSAEAKRLELYQDEAHSLYRCTYWVCDEAHLQRYFAERAPKMRVDGPSRFGQDLRILSRRNWSPGSTIDSATSIATLTKSLSNSLSTSNKTQGSLSTSMQKSVNPAHARGGSTAWPTHSATASNFNLIPPGDEMPNGISTRLKKIRTELQRLTASATASAQIDKLRSELQRLTNEIVKRGEVEVAHVEKTVKQVKRRVTKLQSQIEAEVGKLSKMVSRLPRQTGFAPAARKSRRNPKSASKSASKSGVQATRKSVKSSPKRRASSTRSK